MQAPGAQRTAGVDVKPPFDSGRRRRAARLPGRLRQPNPGAALISCRLRPTGLVGFLWTRTAGGAAALAFGPLNGRLSIS